MINDFIDEDTESINKKISEIGQKITELEHKLTIINNFMINKSQQLFKEINQIHNNRQKKFS